jgi:hypothetical protein
MTPLTKANNLAKFNAEVKGQTSSAGLKTLLETISKSKLDSDTYGKMTALIAGRALELKTSAHAPAEITALSLLASEPLSFTPAKGLVPANTTSSKFATFGDHGWNPTSLGTFESVQKEHEKSPYYNSG